MPLNKNPKQHEKELAEAAKCDCRRSWSELDTKNNASTPGAKEEAHIQDWPGLHSKTLAPNKK